MYKIRAIKVPLIIMIIGSSCIFFSSCREKSIEQLIVFTRTSGKVQDINYITGNSWRYLHQAQIVEIDPANPGKSQKVLSTNFFSACSSEISYDGKQMLFAAQKKENDPWQIWEMNLGNCKSRQITSSLENCIDPEYLPDGQILFSKLSVNDTLKAGHSLYTCNPDGSNLKRITFNPNTYFASSILKDGRVLSVSRQLFPDTGKQLLMVLRPDGTKSELFYKGIKGNELLSPPRETENGKIVFIESEKTNGDYGNVISISYNRPLHTRDNLSGGIDGDFRNVIPLPSGMFLVSWRKSDSERYAIYEFDPEKRILGKVVYSNDEFDLLEVSVIRKHDRPKKLPSEVDTGVKTGLLLCQDINVSDLLSTGKNSSFAKAAQIEIIGIDSSLGIVKTEADGSFYLKVLADKPFRIRALDENGGVLNSACDWIWLRPNERRGCVGCHEDNEQVPRNMVPLAVKNLPVAVPVHINKVIEKKVSLE